MKTKLLYLSFVIFSISFISCGDDVADCSSNFVLGTEIANELSAWTAAGQAWALDPTPENCEAWMEAAQEWLDAYASLQDCANEAGQGTEFAQSLADAQQSVDDMQC